MWEALIDFQRMTVCLNALEELLYWLAKTDQYEGWILIFFLFFFFHDKKMKDNKLDRSIIKLEIKRIPIRIIILKQI